MTSTYDYLIALISLQHQVARFQRKLYPLTRTCTPPDLAEFGGAAHYQGESLFSAGLNGVSYYNRPLKCAAFMSPFPSSV